MDIIARAAAALKPVSDRGIIVRQGWYDGNLKALHITLWNLGYSDALFADDEPEAEAGEIQVNIWSECDQIALKKEIKRLMSASGFEFTEGEDKADIEARVFTNALRFMLLEANE